MSIKNLIKFFSSIGLIFYLSTSLAEVDIDMSQSRLELIDSKTIRVNNVEAIGFGKYWAEFKWNPETFNFDIDTFGKEIPISCSIFAQNSLFCDEGAIPTCDFSQAQKSQIVVGMTYTEVVNIIGCHGVLATRNEIVATYTWRQSEFTFQGSVTFALDGTTPRVHAVF